MVRVRNPEQTRERLLGAAFSEMYTNGYTAASVDRILEASGVTKGALYHHFGSKKALAQAVIDGMIREMVVESWLVPLGESTNAIDGIQACIRGQMEQLTPERIACGCPLNNLAQELSASDEDFRGQIDEVYGQWRGAIQEALERGREAGDVRADVNPADVAAFVVASVAGIAGFAKSTRDVREARSSVHILCEYLDFLRPVTPS